MPSPRTKAPSLQSHLLLHRFICLEFGYDDLDAMLRHLRQAPAGFGNGGESEYAKALYLSPASAKVAPSELAQYDRNLWSHSCRLRMAGEQGRSWKPHQYLALLFTERYLHRYFDDTEALCADLNLSRAENRILATMPDYLLNDLRTLAFQSATGSGKTLLMHCHILQYRHYLERAGGRLNNIVLVTPNEQLSVQHERELQESGVNARLFSSEAQSDLFATVEIIDLNKLAERKGVKRVAVADFGDDNLVLVDEGHLGASGKVWRERRKELSRGGFTFEYSATFNQVTSKKENLDLLNAYGKCLLFDYPYRQFHRDGYGKDYAILNLPGGVQDDNSRMYLLGCLLTFYQQCRIWRDNGALWHAFNPAKPLWVFLGKTVTGSSKADQATRSDVIHILNFLGWVLARGEQVRPMLERLLAGQSGLLDDTGKDCFAGRLRFLPAAGEDLYTDICQTLFHGLGRLHVVYLTAGEGELHLRTGDNDPFGVVNVGDSAKLYGLLTDSPNPDFDVERELGFARRLFADVDRADSTLNIVVGARRFIAGWNSWRVSTLGLMHVGVGEGPEIIQMFGRGVRLKGHGLSLKRHRALGLAPPGDSEQLAELERLHIFGLRADYMQTFRDLLQKEGMGVEQAVFQLPVTWNFGKQTDLKLMRLKENRRYDLSAERPVLPAPGGEDSPLVTLDLYSRLQVVASASAAATSQDAARQLVSLKPYVPFFNLTRIYDRLLRRKQQRGWPNMAIEQRTVERLLHSDDWYELHLPPERLDLTGFDQLRGLEDIALDLLTEYADRFWRKQRRRWEHQQIEIATLDEDDLNNIRAYRLSVNAAQAQLVEDAKSLADQVRKGQFDELAYWYENLQIGTLPEAGAVHAYKPLLHAGHAGKERVVQLSPVPLDDSERQVVHELARLANKDDACLQGKELFLIRNLTQGRGLSFFDDYHYYPDFIVWLKDAAAQHLMFLDPKGLSRFGDRERQKVRLHHEIAEVEQRVRELDADLHLHAYVLSATPASRIGVSRRPTEWRQDGVYFLNEPDCLQQVLSHALRSEP